MKKLIYSLALCGSLTVVPTISEAALGDATLHPGTSNSDVKELQQKLKNKGYFTYGTTTNYYGSITTSAVKSFQRANGLSADGIAGPATFNKLLGSGSSSSSSISSSSLLRVGSRGSSVQSLQQQLKNKGYFKGTTTQYFGSITKNAVMAFQRANGLSVDGIAGPATLSKLKNGGSSASTGGSSSSSSTILRQGMKGSAVSSLQQKLKNKGYFSAGVTGYFGSITTSAVKSFQRANGLLVDGEAGPDTLNKLNSSSSKPSTSTGSSTSSSSASKVISYGKRFMGTPYVWGGSAPGGFDCSGFITYVYRNAVGVSLPRTVASIYQTGTRVSSPQPGDIVFFETYKPGASHAGIYLGNGQFLNASSSQGVTISSMSNSYWSKRYLGAKRYL
ncbi:peptidoglycan-binding protein [Priestia megaterium]|uniref:C40 family peptidase n=1 Tax=Priestia megaterium TaxID=1404 RepID=UPI001C216512|nr:peptidoglycan-binding protein [Priestia megaterium]MBU8689634.1 peptidoglycan-binding protein [Priestia megaterium]MDI3094062.1 peptidoglycan-binding protein [Priestia megaterium]